MTTIKQQSSLTGIFVYTIPLSELYTICVDIHLQQEVAFLLLSLMVDV